MTSPALWSTDEAYRHLKATFDEACASHPGVMEPYIVLLSEAWTREDEIRTMREGLRKTVTVRYPGALPR